MAEGEGKNHDLIPETKQTHLEPAEGDLAHEALVRHVKEVNAMPRLKLHYEGWVALPDAFRRRLGLERGAELEAELVDGTIVLRPAKGSARAGEEGSTPELSKAVLASLDHAAEAREPEQPAAVPEAPPAPKRRGRPPKAKAQRVEG